MEKAKKMKCYKRLICKQFPKSQVFVAHSFWIMCRNVSPTLVELFMETPYWCTVLVHQYGRRKSKKTSGVHFFYKSSFFSLENYHICTYTYIPILEMVILLKIKIGDFFSTRQHSYFGVTHWENSEVQIAVFSKWNMLREWKQRFSFCLSSTLCI